MSDEGADGRINDIVIVGGGTTGWMAAASLVRFLPKPGPRITLVESSEIGTIGVGEATIPPIIDFIRALGMDEDQLIRRCNATFKLAIKFVNWREPEGPFLHPFGQTGYALDGVDFSAWWLSRRLAGRADRLESYSLTATAAEAGRFQRPSQDRNSPLSGLTYALHFDAALFGEVLKEYAMTRGVGRVDARIAGAELDGETGFVEAVRLEDGRTVKGDLFIDCSGFRGLLIEQALGAGFEDWRRWLPCNRAIAVQTDRAGPLSPYTLAAARPAGWQWRIPLQSRVGNGYVYSGDHIQDDDAEDALLKSVVGAVIAPPRRLRFTAGRRRKFWIRNCIALGLAGGFLEPLESTSIHLVQRGLALLLKLFPDRHCAQAEQDQYNAMLAYEYERIRDFIVLHYLASRRDNDFWQDVRAAAPPDSLAHRIELFSSHGRIIREENELFPAQSWLYLFTGFGLLPRYPDPFAGARDPGEMDVRLEQLKGLIGRTVADMPAHPDFIAAHCSAQSPAA